MVSSISNQCWSHHRKKERKMKRQSIVKQQDIALFQINMGVCEVLRLGLVANFLLICRL